MNAACWRPADLIRAGAHQLDGAPFDADVKQQSP
jgi:hypothetical protein